MSKHVTIKAQRIAYSAGRVIQAGETYKASNGATVIVKEFFLDFDGGLLVSYSAMHPEMDNGKWASGDTTPNGLCNWLWAA